MITINLLPEDLRTQTTGGPASTQLLFIGIGASIGLVSLGFYLFVHFYLLANEQEKLQALNIERESLKIAEKQHEELTKMVASFKTHYDAVEKCRSVRIPFARKLHEFSSLIVVQNPTTWIGSISITPQAKGAFHSWKAPATTADNKLEAATAVHRSIQKSEFYKDFTQISIPRYTKVDLTGYIQKVAWNFDLSLTMKMRTFEQLEAEKKQDTGKPK